MEDEYKVICALSNSATFYDLEWPRTPVSRSQYSLKANISQMVHPIHSMFGSRLGVWGLRIEWHYLRFHKIQDGGWRPSWNDGAVARNHCISWAFLFLSHSWQHPSCYANDGIPDSETARCHHAVMVNQQHCHCSTFYMPDALPVAQLSRKSVQTKTSPSNTTAQKICYLDCFEQLWHAAPHSYKKWHIFQPFYHNSTLFALHLILIQHFI